MYWSPGAFPCLSMFNSCHSSNLLVSSVAVKCLYFLGTQIDGMFFQSKVMFLFVSKEITDKSLDH